LEFATGINITDEFCFVFQINSGNHTHFEGINTFMGGKEGERVMNADSMEVRGAVVKYCFFGNLGLLGMQEELMQSCCQHAMACTALIGSEVAW
jgi:hypothetical protein